MNSVAFKNDILVAATKYIKRGWFVFPLHSIGDEGHCTCGNVTCSDAGKHPRVAGGFKAATLDLSQIEKWFGADAPLSNIGIATGEISGITVIDIDIGEGKFGYESWMEATRDHGEPDTLMAQTGSGGMHVIFNYNSVLKTASNVLGKGVDSRNDGGYIVAVPSRHRSGGVYSWLNPETKIGNLPSHLSRRKETRGRPRKDDMYKGKYSIEQVTAMLEHVPSDDRDLWRSVGIILGREFNRAEPAWELYIEWSDKDGGKKGRNHDEIMHEAFYDISQQFSENQLSIGTIVKAAVDNGWSCGTEESDEDFVKALALLPLMDFYRVADTASKKLGVTKTELTQIVKAMRTDIGKSKKSESGVSILFEETEPYHEPVNGAILFDDVLNTLQNHVIADDETLYAATLWIAMTWMVDYCTVLPLAVITAPEKGCGKTTLLTTMGRMVYKQLPVSNISPAAMFRTIEAYRPTLLLDETDASFKDNEELRGLVNSGHTRDAAYVLRVVGDEHEPRVFSTWCPKLLCGIGRLPPTIESRAIILKMRRKTKGESVKNIRHSPIEMFADLKSKLARWSEDNATAFANLHPIMEGLDNRNADNYEPLLALAMLADDEWVKRIKVAAYALCTEDSDNLSVNEELLQDIRKIFELHGKEQIKTVDLLTELCRDDDAPWKTYNRGKEFSSRQLAKRLAEYGIKSKNMRLGSSVQKGYELKQFLDVFSRYLDNNDNLSEKQAELPATTLPPNIDTAYSVANEFIEPMF